VQEPGVRGEERKGEWDLWPLVLEMEAERLCVRWGTKVRAGDGFLGRVEESAASRGGDMASISGIART
jgi:hypothetical protein